MRNPAKYWVYKSDSPNHQQRPWRLLVFTKPGYYQLLYAAPTHENAINAMDIHAQYCPYKNIKIT